MAKKLSGWKTKGMNRDLSVSAFNPEFAFENMNLRLATNDGNTTMSWVNEKGTSSVPLFRRYWTKNSETTYIDPKDQSWEYHEAAFDLVGTCIGTAVLNHYLVLFITNGTSPYADHIYRLEYNSDKSQLYINELFYGNINFSVANPLETLVSYESEHIQKVYWTDGINQPRLINIAPDNDAKINDYTNTSFDFITTLALNETVKVKKVLGGGGMFAPGVIQYAFTYYNKYGQESNIFYTTPLYYISHQDRGGSPEDKIDNAFKISITGVDDNFDYLRIYSIQRTSINGTPMCKRIQDIAIADLTNASASYIDTGTNGDSIDPTELLYKGGNVIRVGTMEQKDNTLFMGDITTPQNVRPQIQSSDVTLSVDTRSFFPTVVSGENYEYANQLTSLKAVWDAEQSKWVPSDESVPCAGFKYGDFYRCGVQFQDKTGKWSDPVFIDDKEVTTASGGTDIHPGIVSNVVSEDENDLPITVIVYNKSSNPITILQEAFIAIETGTEAQVLRVILGSDPSYTIVKNTTQTFSSAIVKSGKNYYNKEFCTVPEHLSDVRMAHNCALANANGYVNVLTMENVKWDVIGETPRLPNPSSTSHTYTFECSGSPEPGPSPEPTPTPASDVYINMVLHNTSNEDMYITGYIYLGVWTANKSDWGPLAIRFDTVSHGNALYKISAGHTATVSYEHLHYSIASTKPGEVPSKYFGGDFAPSIYCRVYSWTLNSMGVSAHDPAVIEAQLVTTVFQNGLDASNPGTIEFNLPWINHNEGTIVPASNPIVLDDAVLTRGASLMRSGTRSITEETVEESIPLLRSGSTLAATGTAQDIVTTVPVIEGTITSSAATTLLAQGYKKVRAVVVYPDMQSRKVICQGVGCPTLYTANHREKNLVESMGDLWAQSSWFFRPKNKEPYEYYNTVNTPSSGTSANPNANIEYMNRDDSPRSIKRVEIQGHYEANNKFTTDWTTLTLHSPDIEFDDSLVNLDYTSDILKYVNVGEASFLRTFSDIDIQTETPTISDKGAGFVKKSFISNGARGIISGLFWEDYEVDDWIREQQSPFTAFHWQKAPMKWMVYLWNRTGSLNNDIERPADSGVASAVLKRKIVSNLRFTNTKWITISENQKSYKSSLFYSDQPEILKLNIGNPSKANVYMGNIDTMLTSDAMDGMYFALPQEAVDYNNNYVSPLFNSDVLWVTYEDEYGNHGNRTYANNDWYIGGSGSTFQFMNTVGDTYSDIVLKKCSVRMKYKSTPHIVMVQEGNTSIYGNVSSNSLPVFELQRNIQITDPTLFGGKSDDAKKALIWIPCGEPVRLDNLVNIAGEGEDPEYVVPFEYSWGDTYYQRWDCLKTYAFTPEDINQVVEIGSFMLETRVNIDGRYDRNRGQLSNLYMSPRNFNLINPVYSQQNNFFTYRIQDEDAYNEKKYPTQITWSKTKTSGADVDLWTNVTLASVLEMDGDKGKVRKLARLNNNIICFQDKGIAQILYNDRVQINTQDGVPIEISNSDKVQGKNYITDSIGCSNKWSMTQTPSGIYFMDSINKAIFMFNGQLNNLSGSLGFNTWSKKTIPSSEAVWNPRFPIYEDNSAFMACYDKQNQDVLFVNKETALAYSEKLQAFTSFYDYGDSPFFCNLDDTGIWIKNGSETSGTPPVTTYNVFAWKHQAGNYCSFFGTNKPYWMTLVGNPEPQVDKIFTNIEFRACVEGDGELDQETGKFTPALPFDSLESWNEYQHGSTNLKNLSGHAAFMHHTGDDSSLKRKFRIWRSDIPRNNYELQTYPVRAEGETDAHYQERIDAYNEWLANETEKGIYRQIRKPQDRMRNPWLYLKLMKNVPQSGTLPMTEIHDILMTYFD